MNPKDYSVHIAWNSQEKLWLTRCVEIPSCCSQGSSIDDAVESVFDAIEDHRKRANDGIRRRLV